MSLFRSIITSQIWLSSKFDRLVPDRFKIDGNRDFLAKTLPRYLRHGTRVYDVGGGKQPCVGIEKKKELALELYGMDISETELTQAPAGLYDHIVCADIQVYQGSNDADLVVCQALLEHVPNNELAFKTLASLVKDNGYVLIFVPSRRALYAQLNKLLPESLKKKILFTIFPHTRYAQGFPAFYDRCVPSQFRELALASGFEIKELNTYFMSSYFSFFFPFYFVWRIWIFGTYLLFGEDAAETFSMVLQRKMEGQI